MNRWQQIEELFQCALERESERRAEFLAEACDGDTGLRREVESLLAFDGRADGMIDSPAFKIAAQLMAGDEEESMAGRRVGPYEIVREIGRGGMGVVYLAERADGQYQKRVAVKVIKGGGDTRDVMRRFRHERQIAAGLDHPNIARLLDGGTTEAGLPYFVMEYIEGAPVDRYCDEHELTVAERLRLFRAVCSAVHHAHQNLVVHRDIKPSNILVTADGSPKLLDFGIAKVLGPQSSSQTPGHTETQLRLMTPEYASPEQIRGETVTTATDVYSLGVMLYKLLTGRHPHRIEGRPPHEVAQAICETEPEKPSQTIEGDLRFAIADLRLKRKPTVSRNFFNRQSQIANPCGAILITSS